MKKIANYVSPDIKVCDYISRNGYCIEMDPDITTSGQLGKEDNTEFEPEETNETNYKRSVWDD